MAAGDQLPVTELLVTATVWAVESPESSRVRAVVPDVLLILTGPAMLASVPPPIFTALAALDLASVSVLIDVVAPASVLWTLKVLPPPPPKRSTELMGPKR